MTAKRIFRAASTLLTAILLTTAGLALAESRPYFVANDGDVFTGGWFYDPGGLCQTGAATYQAPDYSDLNGTRYDGAIMAFGTDSPRAGAHVGSLQAPPAGLDAFALGMIEGGASSYGFYTGLSGSSDLSFSNQPPTSPQANSWGGFFEGDGARPDHCIPNYWAKRTSPPAAQPISNVNPTTDATGNYLVNNSTTIGGGVVAADKNLAYFINGDLNINGPITYAPYNADTVPKFVVVVCGDIFIDPGVNQLDGWYISQDPSSASGCNLPDGGTIWSCHDGDAARLPVPSDIWVRTNCNIPLTVNGAFTAKQVNLLRINGGLNTAAPAGPPAEIFNYTPAMVIGGPFFNAPPGQGSLDSLISLPPVF